MIIASPRYLSVTDPKSRAHGHDIELWNDPRLVIRLHRKTK